MHNNISSQSMNELTPEDTANSDILIVDDEPKNVQLLGSILQKENYNIEFALNGEEAIEWVNSHPFQMILLDIMMPGIDGLEVCRHIKAETSSKDVPIIFLSAKADSESINKGFDAGAVDYLTKPFNTRELLSRIQSHLLLSQLQNRLKATNQILEKKVAERTGELEQSNLKLQKEIVDREKIQNRLAHLNHISTLSRKTLDLKRTSDIFIKESLKAFLQDGSGSILLHDVKTNTLKHYGSHGLDVEYMKGHEIEITKENKCLDKLFSSQKGVINNSNEISIFQTLDTDRLHNGKRGFQEMVIPLTVQDKIIGVVTISSYEGDTVFSEEDFSLMENIASNMSNHFENGLLYEKTIHLNNSYERFVPNQFLGLLGKENIENVNLGDQVEKHMTILFSDIRSFTHLSEELTPQENFSFINSYLYQMGPIVRENNGFIDKFIGDSIMALFEENTNDALRAAIQMLQKLKEYNAGRKRAGYRSINIGIGVNTGNVIMGTLGENNKMGGTIIGDVVNLASRMEELTKTYQTPLLISHLTLRDIKNPSQFSIRFIDRVSVKSKAISVYEVYDFEPIESIKKKNMTKDQLKKAWEHYGSQQYEAAESLYQKCLEQCPDDTVAQKFVERCADQKALI